MFLKILFLIVICSVLDLIHLSHSSDSFITRKCHLSDEICITDIAQEKTPSFVAGLPDYGVQVLDPLTIKHVDCSVPNFKLLFDDVIVRGIRNAKVQTIKFDQSANKVFYKFIANVELDANYELNGQLLGIPFTGSGKAHAKIYGIEFYGDIFYDIVIGKDGLHHIKLTKNTYKYTLTKENELVLENLVPQNDILKNAAQDFISKNANAIITDVGEPLLGALFKSIIKNIANFVNHMSLEEHTLQ